MPSPSVHSRVDWPMCTLLHALPPLSGLKVWVKNVSSLGVPHSLAYDYCFQHRQGISQLPALQSHQCNAGMTVKAQHHWLSYLGLLAQLWMLGKGTVGSNQSTCTREKVSVQVGRNVAGTPEWQHELSLCCPPSSCVHLFPKQSEQLPQ